MGRLYDPALLSEIRPQVLDLSSEYSARAYDLLKFNPSLSDIKQEIDVVAINSLGEWSQLINLIVARLNQKTTYLYLIIAVFADFMMVGLFALSRRNPMRRGFIDQEAPGRPW